MFPESGAVVWVSFSHLTSDVSCWGSHCSFMALWQLSSTKRLKTMQTVSFIVCMHNSGLEVLVSLLPLYWKLQEYVSISGHLVAYKRSSKAQHCGLLLLLLLQIIPWYWYSWAVTLAGEQAVSFQSSCFNHHLVYPYLREPPAFRNRVNDK